MQQDSNRIAAARPEARLALREPLDVPIDLGDEVIIEANINLLWL
jgi:hypothetical protein